MKHMKLRKIITVIILNLISFTFITALNAVSVQISNKSPQINEQKDLENEIKLQNENIEKINIFITQTDEYLTKRGYETKNVSFLMKFKDNWSLNFSNKVILNKKKLPIELSADIYNKYFTVFGSDPVKIFSLPNGLIKLDKISFSEHDKVLKINQIADNNLIVSERETEELSNFEKKNCEANDKLNTFFQEVNNYLKTNGYQTEQTAFYMKFKNYWHLNLNNKVYLNNQSLPQNVTNDIYKLYFETTKDENTLIISLPDGLEKI